MLKYRAAPISAPSSEFSRVCLPRRCCSCYYHYVSQVISLIFISYSYNIKLLRSTIGRYPSKNFTPTTVVFNLPTVSLLIAIFARIGINCRITRYDLAQFKSLICFYSLIRCFFFA